jgi:ATP adenylyltransferase
MEFIAGPREPGCLFCRTGHPDGPDAANLVLWRGRTAFVIMNRYPYASGHLMVAPYRHTADLAALAPDEAAELLGLAGRCTRVLTDSVGAEGHNLGFNLGKAAGAGVADHMHLHVVPRWVGDTNFLAILGDTRAMPEYLSATYAKLAAHFQTGGS